MSYTVKSLELRRGCCKMPHTDVANIPINHLSTIGLTPSDKPDKYCFGNTIKNTIIDPSSIMDVKHVDANVLKFTISKSNYIEAILNELYFGSFRIDAQCRNVSILHQSGGQAAWVLVTAYYASFFIVNDITKASGRFTINISDQELRFLTDDRKFTSTTPHIIEANNNFHVTVKASPDIGEVELTLTRNRARPHQAAWQIFHTLAREKFAKARADDGRICHFDLIKSISSGERWALPSTIRNNWNYSKSIYFNKYGDTQANTFMSIIKSQKSSFMWATNNTLRPSDENTCASIAYIYHVLHAAHSKLIERLKI